MDLPKCPACGQSVLDDDVADCPFCGASMTAKPQAAVRPPSRPVPPASPPPAKPAKPSEASASRTTASKPAPRPAPSARPRAQQEELDDMPGDPLAVDLGAGRNAVAATRKPQKDRTYKVVCPMCETVGFVPRKAAGREVRCPNPQCLVPVFTAPEIKKKKVVTEEKSSFFASGGFVLLLAAVLLVGGAGGAVWFMLSRSRPSPLHAPVATSPGEDPESKKSDPGKVDQANAPPEEGSEPAPPALPTPAEMQARVLEQSEQTALIEESNRSKPFCRQLTAEAFAQAGDLAGAQRQLEQLKVVGAQLPYYKVSPLARMALVQLASGDPAGANASLDEAWTAAQELPRSGRMRLDASMLLATALAAAGRADQARSLMASHRGSDELGRLAADVFCAKEMGVFDLAALKGKQLVFDWKAPQEAAVTIGLATRGYWDASLAWAKGQQDLDARVECTAAWAAQLAEDAVRRNQADRLEQVSSGSEGLPPAATAIVLARAAARRVEAGDAAGGRAMLEQAEGALEGVNAAPPVVLPDMKTLYRYFSLPDAAPIRLAAYAAAETARVELLLENREAAWKQIVAALEYCRGAAPSMAAIRERLQPIESNPGAVQAELEKVLELRNDDEARRALRNYTKICGDLEEAARTRHQWETTILAEAALWGLRDEVWKELQARVANDDINRKQPDFETRLAWILAADYRAAGNAGVADEITAAATNTGAAADRWLAAEDAIWAHLSQSRWKEAGQEISRLSGDRAAMTRLTLRLGSRLVHSEQPAHAFQFVQAIPDQVLREEAFENLAALAVRLGKPEAAFQFFEMAKLPPTERIAVGRGFVAGYQAARATVAPETTTKTGG